MQGKNVEVTGQTVTIQAKSAATAREIAAMAEAEVLKKEGGFLGWVRATIEDVGDGIAGVNKAIGRGTFEGISWVLLVVGSVIAFLAWSRLLPVGKEDAAIDGATFIGLVGVAVVIGCKVAAGRWALAHNQQDRPSAEFYARLCIAALAVDAIAAFAFATAVTQDAETGRIDYDVKIAAAEREAKDLDYAAEEMPRPADGADLLQMDLDRLLNRTAKNKAGTLTDRSVGSWIGWGTDAYCMPAKDSAFYIDRYCEEVIEADRALRQRLAYEAAVQAAQAKRDEAEKLRAERPEQASALTAGKALKGVFGDFGGYLTPVALMAIILGLMAYTAYVAKRIPSIPRAQKET